MFSRKMLNRKILKNNSKNKYNYVTTMRPLKPINEETEIIFIIEDNLETKNGWYSFDYNKEKELLIKIDILSNTNRLISLQFISKNIIWIEQNKHDKDQLNEHIVCFWFKSMKINEIYKPPWKLKFLTENALITFLEKVNKLDI
jgi:hypothetical protein